MQDTLNYRHLNTVLDYMSTDIETMYENNIKQRFCSYVERFVNVSLQKRDRTEAVKASEQSAEQKKEQINILCRELRKVKNDILSQNDPKTSDVQYHAWIDEQSVRIMPQRELRENSVYYDIQCNPQD
jgi:isocitrate dehydrogenase kinase/phosphatase